MCLESFAGFTLTLHSGQIAKDWAAIFSTGASAGAFLISRTPGRICIVGRASPAGLINPCAMAVSRGRADDGEILRAESNRLLSTPGFASGGELRLRACPFRAPTSNDCGLFRVA